MSLHCVLDSVCCIHLIQLKPCLICKYALHEIMSQSECYHIKDVTRVDCFLLLHINVCTLYNNIIIVIK